MSRKEHSLPDLVLTDSNISRDEEKFASVDKHIPKTRIHYPRNSSQSSNTYRIHVTNCPSFVIGSFLVLFCSVGFVNASGIFQEYYSSQTLVHKSPSEISWLCSFNVFCMFGATIIVGYLNDKHGPRV
ncbi:hypothetical protein IFR05_009126 [Cadophora sp. M221]|nr:hypothetical protein IFR05_009126 [Cadophora sp. M221]